MRLLASDLEKLHDDYAELAKAIIRLVKADENLEEAKSRVPDYTGQYSAADYVAEEQSKYNSAAEMLGRILIGK